VCSFKNKFSIKIRLSLSFKATTSNLAYKVPIRSSQNLFHFYNFLYHILQKLIRTSKSLVQKSKKSAKLTRNLHSTHQSKFMLIPEVPVPARSAQISRLSAKRTAIKCNRLANTTCSGVCVPISGELNAGIRRRVTRKNCKQSKSLMEST
jgi:hypothetical protein